MTTIMFWNIENVYDYKIVTPDELELEKQNQTEEEKKAKEGEELAALKKKSKNLFQQTGTAHREQVASIIKAVDPDIVVLVELSVRRSELLKSGKVSDTKFVEFDHWGPRQYQVSLNDLYEKERWWASATSQVNCSDLVKGLDAAGNVKTITHRNTMFELYGLLWDTKKVDLVGDFRVTDRGTNGKLNFFQRNPGVARFQEVGETKRQFLLVMVHSGYGGKDEAVLKKRGKVISNLMYLNDVDRAINGPKFSPVVVAGDFNLDYESHAEYYKPLKQERAGKAFKARINGKTSLRKKLSGTSYTLHAYDNIFTRGFANDDSPGGIKDFVKDKFEEQLEKALQISNHLPVYATVRF